MASKGLITLFDLPSRPPQKCWSLNPWKTRLALNFKGLDYRTEWSEYPDLKGKLEGNVPPNKEGMAYTSPTVMFTDGSYVMESRAIAKRLEELHPSPSLHLDSPYLAKLENIVSQLMPTLSGVFIPLVVRRVLGEQSQPYFTKTREARFGMPLDKLAEEKGGDIGFKQAEPYLQQITALLKEDSSGPFFMGKDASYADLVWAGILLFFHRIGEDVYEQLLKTTGDADLHSKLYEAVKPWSKRDDH